MYAGQIVEYGTLEEIYNNTKHPFTQGLFDSIPSMTKKVKRLSPIEGLTPDPSNLPEGCPFHPRCKYATEECKKQAPENIEICTGHTVRCNRYKGGE